MNLGDHPRSVEFNEKYPIVTCLYPEWEKINGPLEYAIKEVGDQQSYKTNVKALMTSWTMWEDSEPGFVHFREICDFACRVARENSPAQAWQPTVTHCWGAVFKKDEFVQQHNHWPSLWSFTYYVKISKDCAPIVFPGAGKSVHPQPGTFCLFPGWVDHYVPHHEADKERIMVAGNIANQV